ncbi:MAG: hypothetical protein WBG53_04005 [Rhodococcus sp. (in: high G+C Gram-positive bacteria)]|nr:MULTISPECIES: hypothetical protein [unclassified Rhodococcus (in: high G+C Gram-positive bacteria)]
MTTRTAARSRGVTSVMADGVSFSGLVTTLATTIVLGVALGLVVAGAW